MVRRGASPLAWVALLGAVLGCDAYDAGLLRDDPSSLAASMAGASTGVPGSCSEADNDAGCCPRGLGPAEDADCGYCGDGIIGAGESCDPPESCLKPRDCQLPSACVQAEFTGKAEECNARCEVKPLLACRDGDGCCASTCDHLSDSDCSKTCGDGVVDHDVGETCEPNPMIVEMKCPARCDDGDACTEDVSTGSPEACSMACTHVRIATPVNGDGCCPPGAHALNDSDCPARCGNGVIEPSEACDGGASCSRSCSLDVVEADTDAQRCLGILGDDACATCACSKCTEPMLRCYQSGDPTRDARCSPVVECAQQADCIGGCRTDDAFGCYGQYCYCGTALCPGTGPCRAQIATAAASTVAGTIASRARDPSYSLYDAEQYGACLKTSCPAECGL